MKTLYIANKEFRPAFKQVKRYFNRNPNRRRARLIFTDQRPSESKIRLMWNRNIVRREDYVYPAQPRTGYGFSNQDVVEVVSTLI